MPPRIATLLLLTALSMSQAKDPAEKLERLTPTAARNLIRGHLLAQTNVDLGSKFPVAGRTTDKIWDRLGSQVFTYTDAQGQKETMLIQGGKAHALGRAFGIDRLLCSPHAPREESGRSAPGMESS